jgi:hypothetical protein
MELCLAAATIALRAERPTPRFVKGAREQSTSCPEFFCLQHWAAFAVVAE